jgi:predicted nuclease of predicted toxin-antitoxin system
MQFLVDEDLPRSTHAMLQKYDHSSKDVRDIGLRGAKDYQVAAYARSKGLCLLTGDLDFSNVQNYPPGEYAGIVVLRLPGTATASFILSLLESFLQQKDLVTKMPGKMAIVELGRVRIRAA